MTNDELNKGVDLVGAVPYVGAVAKGGLAAYQLFSKVKRTNTTTPEEREQLEMARQAQAGNLPGYSLYQNRLAQGQNAAVQNAALGSGSASDFLAANAAADRVRQQGENQLAVQGQQYHDRATQQLSSVLSAMATHSRQDTDRAAQANSALKGAGINNLANGANEAATVAAYQLAQKKASPATAGVVPDAGYPPNYGPYGPYNSYRKSINPFLSGYGQ